MTEEDKIKRKECTKSMFDHLNKVFWEELTRLFLLDIEKSQ